MTSPASGPLVSVLTPSLNQGRFIGDCLALVAHQTYANIEHVVMDGGSTDETLSILEPAPGNVRWSSEPDRGQSHALNKALAQAGGDIIGWLNSDDAYVDARSVAGAVALFAAHPGVGLVYGHTLLINAGNLALQYFWAPPAADRLLVTGTRFAQPAVFLRRSALPRPFVREDLHYLMDRDLWLRLHGKTGFRRLGLVVGADRQHGSRKIMSEGFQHERASYEPGFPASIWPHRRRQALALLLRERGVLDVPWLHRRIQPAFDLRFDPGWRFALRQAFQPRLRMPGALTMAIDGESRPG